MSLKNIRVGFCITGSFCTFSQVPGIINALTGDGADVTAIISEIIDTEDTRFSQADEFRRQLEILTGKAVVRSIPQAEPTGPKKLYDIMIVAPCTGNTAAKLAHSISDTTVTLAVKAHLRNNRPVVLGIASNDALGGNAANIGALFNAKNYFFVPFFQDDPVGKEKSIFFRTDLVGETVNAALQGRQLQPMIERK